MTLYNKLNRNRIDLIVCDGDRTLIDFEDSEFGSSWDLVGQLYCPRDEWQRHAREYRTLIKKEPDRQMQEMIYADWVVHNISILKGHDATPALKAEIPYTRGVREYFPEYACGTTTAILSGGIDIIFERVRQDLGMQHCITNVVGVDARRRFDGTITLQVVMHNKYQKFLELMNMTATTEMRRVMALGDGLNDIEMLTAVRNGGGLAVAINPISDEVAMAANAAIHDFTELKKYAERQ